MVNEEKRQRHEEKGYRKVKEWGLSRWKGEARVGRKRKGRQKR